MDSGVDSCVNLTWILAWILGWILGRFGLIENLAHFRSWEVVRRVLNLSKLTGHGVLGVNIGRGGHDVLQ